VNFDLEPVRYEAHHTGRFDPWDLLQLCFSLSQRNKENIAANVAAHDFHDLRARHVLQSTDINVVAGLYPEPPGTLSIVVERGDRDSAEKNNAECYRGPSESSNSFLWE
jgi:hypothetical protein